MNDVLLDLSDNSWLCVRGDAIDSICEIFDLSPVHPAGWPTGVSAVFGDFWDSDTDLDAPLSRVFIPPPVRDWTFVIGGWVGAAGRPGLLTDELCVFLKQLSARFGSAHAFGDQGRMDWYQWILTNDGVVDRLFVWDGMPIRDEGTAPECEPSRRADDEEERAPSPIDVGIIASELTVSWPDFVEASKSGDVGHLAVTPWGREHGVPKRSLG